jgi:H+-transporting ATPase
MLCWVQDKRTEAVVQAPDGTVFKVTKGAPQVILRLAHNAAELRERVTAAVQDLADRGFRALGVAISYTGKDEEPLWQFQGVSVD